MAAGLKSVRPLADRPEMKPWMTGAVAAALLIGAGFVALDAWRVARHMPAASVQGTPKPLREYVVDPGWIREGKPVFRTVETGRSADSRTATGLWDCTGPGTFEWQFDIDETVHILEGEVRIDYRGSQFVLRPGDVATFHAGTRAVWRVDKYVKKVWMVQDPGRLTRWWRARVS